MHLQWKTDYCQLLLIRMVDIILMFKSVRLYFIIAFVTRTNICRCWTILDIVRRRFHIIWLSQSQLWQRSSITYPIFITARYLFWPNSYKEPKKRSSKPLVAYLNSSLLQKTVEVKNPGKIYFKLYGVGSFLELNLCQHLGLIRSFKIC